MSNNAMTDAERQEFLKSIGLNPDAPNLTPVQKEKAKTTKPKPKTAKPDEASRRTIHPTDIEFDEADIEGFDLTSWPGKKEAIDHLFGLYKSPGRDRDRNPLLWRLVGEFVGKVARSRTTGTPVVKEKIKATKEQRDLAAFLAENGITLDDVAALVKAAE